MANLPAKHSSQIFPLEPLSFDWDLTFVRTETTRACDYWRSRCGANSVPSRTDIVPGDMRPFLANVGLIEIRKEQGAISYFVRHAGTRWEAVFGGMAGKELDDFLSPEIKARWHACFDAVCEAVRPVRVTTRIAYRDKAWLRTELLVAPLSENSIDVSMLFICFTSWSETKTS